MNPAPSTQGAEPNPSEIQEFNRRLWGGLFYEIDHIDVAEAVIKAMNKDAALRKSMSALYVRALETRHRHIRQQQARQAMINAVRQGFTTLTSALLGVFQSLFRSESKTSQFRLF